MKPLDRQYVVRHIFLASFTVLCFFAFFFFSFEVFPSLSKTASRCAQLEVTKIMLAPRLSGFCALPE